MDSPTCLVCTRLFHNAPTFSFHLALLWSWCSFSRWFQISKPFLAARSIKGGTIDLFVSIFLNFAENWHFFWSSFRLIYYKWFKLSVMCLSRLADSNDIQFMYFGSINYLIKCRFFSKSMKISLIHVGIRHASNVHTLTNSGEVEILRIDKIWCR